MLKKNIYISWLLVISINIFSSVNNQNFRDKAVSSSYNVLAIRVQFKKDHLKTTTGNGLFNSSEYPDSVKVNKKIKRPKVIHDKSYFEDNLLFVKNYFEEVSNGGVKIDKITVLDQIVNLDEPMYWYNPNNGNDTLNSKLLLFQQKVWSRVKGIDSLSQEYDSFVIYHAGSGQEFSTPIDETPHDLPSSYFSEEELKTSGKMVASVSNTIILPEIEWQRYEKKWIYSGMTGVAVLMFAHRLGLPNLYGHKKVNGNLETISGVGRFDLMDQGSGNFYGMIPSKPSAWIKEYKGWADKRNINKNEENIKLIADREIIRIDLSSDEYLLIENRRSHCDLKEEIYVSSLDSSVVGIKGYDRDGREIVFYYEEDGSMSFIADKNFKNLVKVDNYDFAIPASGILIWDINSNKTTNYHIMNNKVNDDPKKKGVKLKEADGSYDIGKSYWLLDPGYGKELGWTYDAYFDSNLVWQKLANKDFDKVELSENTYPSSKSTSGLTTGVRAYGFSNPKDTMTFSLQFSLPESYYIYPDIDKYQIFNDGLNLWLYSEDEIKKIDKNQTSNFMDNLDADINISPTLFGEKLVFASEEKLIAVDISTQNKTIYSPIGSQEIKKIIKNSILTKKGIYFFDENFIVKDSLVGSFIDYIVDDKGVLLALDINGIKKYDKNLQLEVHKDLVVDSISEIYGSQNGGKNIFHLRKDQGIISFNSNLESFKDSIDISNSSFIGVIDADQDGYLEFISAANNSLNIYNKNGTLTDGFPQKYLESLNPKKLLSFKENNERSFVCLSKEGAVSIFKQGKRFDNLFMQNCQDIFLTKFSDGVYVVASLQNQCLITMKVSHNGSLEDYDFGSLPDNNKFYVLNKQTLEKDGIIDKSQVYNWPNPVISGITNFRFKLLKPAAVKIDIYELSGHKITTLRKNYTKEDVLESHDIKWNTNNVESGIYLCRVEFSGNGKETYMVKVSVTH